MDWNNCPVKKNEYYHMLTMMMVQNDVNTIIGLIDTLNQPVIMMTAVPYLTLFCCSYKEYAEQCGYLFEIKNNSTINLNDLRLSLKQFDDRYSKSIEKLTKINSIQDEYYKKLLRFNFLKKLNVNYNIGLYFDEFGNLFSNTQNVYSSFEDKKFQKLLDKNNLVEYGKALGIVLNSVQKGLEETMKPIVPLINNRKFIINYSDQNTKNLFKNFECVKNGDCISLWLLHLLCDVNFIKYVMCEITDEFNPWQFRLKYITFYYTYKNIKRIVGSIENCKIKDVLVQIIKSIPDELINSKMRSNLMHYSFINNGQYQIDDDYIDFKIPYFGLIETLFDGKSYCQVNKQVDESMDLISNTLTKLLHIDEIKYQPL